MQGLPWWQGLYTIPGLELALVQLLGSLCTVLGPRFRMGQSQVWSESPIHSASVVLGMVWCPPVSSLGFFLLLSHHRTQPG